MGSGNYALTDTVVEIRSYRQQNPELLQSHHFLFDLPAIEGQVEYVVMGINPGEPKSDWDRCPEPTEETRLYDWQEHFGRSQASKKWLAKVRRFVGNRPTTLTECFLWSSKDVAHLVERYGPIEKSAHLEFSSRANRRLLSEYAPKAVIFPGLRYMQFVQDVYGLHHVSSKKGPKGARLIEHYRDANRPWIFTKHWSGAWLSEIERKLIEGYIASL
jgi:hypothetical protein